MREENEIEKNENESYVYVVRNDKHRSSSFLQE